MINGNRNVIIKWDDLQLRELAVDLTEAPGRIQRAAPKALDKGADLVQQGMKKDARGHRFLPRFPRAITKSTIDRFTREIGFETTPGTQGRLAHIILYGSVNNLPVYDYTAALRRSTPAIEELLAGTGEDAVLGVKEE